MSCVKLLDCTLRDGGFVNDWNFSKNSITNIFSRLASSKIEYIELGFLNDSNIFDENRTIVPHTKDFNTIFDANIKTDAKLLAMVIMEECSIDNIGLKVDTVVDGIRIVFKKSGIDKAFEFATVCRARGYDIFFQPASITDYSDEEMIALVKKTNDFKPISFYMVDTYGLLDKNKMFHYINIIDEHLDNGIDMGYHSHNNYQLSYATAIEFVERNTKHDIIIDCTLFGMGKSVGNLNTELIVDYLNKSKGREYNNYQILEAIDSEILNIKKSFSWGYSLNGFIAASNNCHPKYVSYLLNKRSLSIGSISKILNKITKENLTTFNKPLIDTLYREYQSVEVDDSISMSELVKLLQNKEILVLATGSSLDIEHEKIAKYIKENSPIVIAVNNVPKMFEIDYCFINNSKRYSKMSICLNTDFSYKTIATSNIVSASRNIDYSVNYERVLVEGDQNIVSDNATLMLFKLLAFVKSSKVTVAGFDGFTMGQNSYVSEYKTFNNNENLELQNKLIGEAMKNFAKEINIFLLTKSQYE